ncbi:MAG TPA: hypothetical protein VK469_05460 [Candidatus Kapabacteria bacterium]|nr:hypothetical protein [Candidatus Kapabacteria bacterium]
MKKYGAIILILGIILYLSYMLFAQDNIFNAAQREQRDQSDQNEQVDRREEPAETGNQKTVESQKMDFTANEGGGEDGEEENYLADDQEIFARKLFQKKLAPLSRQEKIIWAFRLSKSTIFL